MKLFMITSRAGLVLALSILLSHAAQSLAAVAIENTSTYAGSGRWDWTIYVKADAQSLARIECVEYGLHSTFPDPVQKVCSKLASNFGYSANGWGTFTVKVNITYKDGTTEKLEHLLVFREQVTDVELKIKTVNWSKQLEPGWWEWGIHLEGDKKELDRVRCAEYTLHPSFPNPLRKICSKENRFLLSTRGWGAFTVQVKLLLKDNSTRQLSHTLELRSTGDGGRK